MERSHDEIIEAFEKRRSSDRFWWLRANARMLYAAPIVLFYVFSPVALTELPEHLRFRVGIPLGAIMLCYALAVRRILVLESRLAELSKDLRRD